MVSPDGKKKKKLVAGAKAMSGKMWQRLVGHESPASVGAAKE